MDLKVSLGMSVVANHSLIYPRLRRLWANPSPNARSATHIRAWLYTCILFFMPIYYLGRWCECHCGSYCWWTQNIKIAQLCIGGWLCVYSLKKTKENECIMSKYVLSFLSPWGLIKFNSITGFSSIWKMIERQERARICDDEKRDSWS